MAAMIYLLNLLPGGYYSTMEEMMLNTLPGTLVSLAFAVAMKPSFSYEGWAEGDLRERPAEAIRKDQVVLELHPFEIKTILFEL